jgi:hypothetical protein
MPVRAADFTPNEKTTPRVKVYVEEYLWPMLSKEEQERLKDAEGSWPQYPLTLVELADKHPLALPHKHGPTKFAELPKGIQKHLKDSALFKWETKKAKGVLAPDDLIHNPKLFAPVEKHLKEANLWASASASTKYIATVVHYAHFKGVTIVDENVQFPELWPAKPEQLAPAMREFVKPGGPFYSRLTDDEKLALQRAEYRWPDYPLKIKELAARYGEQPPWYTLPAPPPDAELKYQWDKYRIKPGEKS